MITCCVAEEDLKIVNVLNFLFFFLVGRLSPDFLLKKTHKGLFHSGVSGTLCRIRNKFWIPQGRATVRQILRHCKTCKRFEVGSFKMPNMAPFPRSRVSRSLPFQGTGLDYLGPVYAEDGTVMQKRWICLIFTCFVTRTIHLEIVNVMTTEEFICAFRRFVSTRGIPSEVISDNASQFKLGSETIKSVWENTIIKNEIVQNYMSSYGILWKFITELAPWMGGFYERLVGLVKRCLRKTLRKHSFSDVQLLTLLKEIEAVINSRPLVYVDEELKSRTTLTPNHFLAINSQSGIPDVDYDLKDPFYTTCETSSEKLKKLWRKGQNILNSFWKT
ncbi:unnamed protein product [Mytilus coruscus]|uniref:Integrase catalytic domain-containing protein n=1 Tax=Mytilus coruscus TaxID=42192 RepID=A0A6J8CWP0_MYTCO|nr:unnamed protein product [Mytilus coruscus]